MPYLRLLLPLLATSATALHRAHGPHLSFAPKCPPGLRPGANDEKPAGARGGGWVEHTRGRWFCPRFSCFSAERRSCQTASELGLHGLTVEAIMRSTLQHELASFVPPPPVSSSKEAQHHHAWTAPMRKAFGARAAALKRRFGKHVRWDAEKWRFATFYCAAHPRDAFCAGDGVRAMSEAARARGAASANDHPRWRAQHRREGSLGLHILVPLILGLAFACALCVTICVCPRRCAGGGDGELPVAYAPLAMGAGTDHGIVMGEMVSAVGGAVGGIGAAVHGAVVGLVPSGGCDLPVANAMVLPPIPSLSPSSY